MLMMQAHSNQIRFNCAWILRFTSKCYDLTMNYFFNLNTKSQKPFLLSSLNSFRHFECCFGRTSYGHFKPSENILMSIELFPSLKLVRKDRLLGAHKCFAGLYDLQTARFTILFIDLRCDVKQFAYRVNRYCLYVLLLDAFGRCRLEMQ